MKKTGVLLILILFSTLSIQTLSALGAEKTENRNLKNFDAIKVSSGIDLYVRMGDEESVRIEADKDDIDDIKTEVRDGTLRIYVKSRNNWFNWGFSRPRKAFVTVKSLKEINASAGSDVKSENTLEGDIVKVRASSGSDVDLDLYYKTVELDASSGSDARLRGKVKTFVAEASSGSDIKARELQVAIGKLKASSGSDINVTVTDELYAKASSGADIRYYGNPNIRDTDTSSGGDVAGR